MVFIVARDISVMRCFFFDDGISPPKGQALRLGSGGGVAWAGPRKDKIDTSPWKTKELRAPAQRGTGQNGQSSEDSFGILTPWKSHLDRGEEEEERLGVSFHSRCEDEEEEEEEEEEAEAAEEEDDGGDDDMPCLNISTNVALDGVDTSAVLSEATSSVAKLIGKPEAYVMIVLKGSVPMAFGGTEQPAAYGELVSIGGLNADVNKKLSAAIASILESKLSIPKSRFFLKFYDTKGPFFGWNGTTF
ncbi:hypothetical protein NL676_003161 [Syzygium grande]|nr:hypothetical protein NL676_003161 [Syzygium grande]